VAFAAEVRLGRRERVAGEEPYEKCQLLLEVTGLGFEAAHERRDGAVLGFDQVLHVSAAMVLFWVAIRFCEPTLDLPQLFR